MAARILLVDDHPLTRAALAALLEQHGFEVVGEAGRRRRRRSSSRGGSSPTSCCSTSRCPGSTGSSALPRIREAAPECEVVVLTASGTEENLLAAIRGGAAGYLLKSEPPERIVEFLRGVAKGEAALSGAVARRLLEQVRDGGAGSRRPGLDRRGALARASSRCCCCWTSTSAPTRSRRGCSSPSTPSART